MRFRPGDFESKLSQWLRDVFDTPGTRRSNIGLQHDRDAEQFIDHTTFLLRMERPTGSIHEMHSCSTCAPTDCTSSRTRPDVISLGLCWTHNCGEPPLPPMSCASSMPKRPLSASVRRAIYRFFVSSAPGRSGLRCQTVPSASHRVLRPCHR